MNPRWDPLGAALRRVELGFRAGHFIAFNAAARTSFQHHRTVPHVRYSRVTVEIMNRAPRSVANPFAPVAN